MNKRCIICDGFENRPIFQEYGIDILKCLDCGHVYSSYERVQYYDGFFGTKTITAKNDFWYNDAHEQMHKDFCERFLLGNAGKLLDVGCGFGYFVKPISDYPSWQAFGFELSRPAVDFARSRLGLPNVFCGKVEESPFPKNSFDIITLWDVIEHIPNPDPLLAHLSLLLNDDGVLFVHTPNVNIQLPKARLLKFMRAEIDYLEAKEHMHNYSEKTMTRVLNRNGFNNITFIHLKPIQSVSVSKSASLKLMKNLWFYFSVLASHITLGRLNYDNLFVLARK